MKMCVRRRTSNELLWARSGLIVLARKFGNLIGVYEDIDGNVQHRLGRFLRIKTSIDLKKPLKRGTNVKFQGRDLWVSFKYERLPNFCFICGRIGHQMKDCEETDDGDAEEYKEVEEKDQAFGPWLRASPLPKFTMGDPSVKKETSSGCSKSLFSNSVTTKGDPPEKKNNEEGEVNQVTKPALIEVETTVAPILKLKSTNKEVEEVAESLGTVAISTQFHPGETSKSKVAPKTKNWTRKNAPNVPRKPRQATKNKESGKRTSVEVEVAEGGMEDVRGGGTPRKTNITASNENS